MSTKNSPNTNKDGPIHILFCPFCERCILPQTTEICKFPAYKQCPEYEAKLQYLKRKYGPMY